MKRTLIAALAATAALVLAHVEAAFADNGASDTVGAVQVAPTSVSPTVTAGDATVSAPVSVNGSGDNSATGSTGAVQVGGGNTANGSTGTGQVGATSAGVSASGQSSSGSAQAGTASGTSGGNSANRSTGALQVGGAQGTTSAGASGPAGAQDVSVPFGVGSGGGNAADGSTGTIQVGGGSGGGSGAGSTGGSGPVSVLPAIDGARSLAAALTSTPLPAAGLPAPSAQAPAQVSAVSPVFAAGQGRLTAQPTRARSRVVGQGAAASTPARRSATQALRQVVARGVLPFTGLSLLVWAAVALGAAALGLGVRARAVG